MSQETHGSESLRNLESEKKPETLNDMTGGRKRADDGNPAASNMPVNIWFDKCNERFSRNLFTDLMSNSEQLKRERGRERQKTVDAVVQPSVHVTETGIWGK